MDIKSPLISPLLKSFVPLFVGGTYHLLKHLPSLLGLTLNFHSNADGNQRLHDHIESSKSDGMPPSDFLTLFNQFTFGIYENFFVFLLIMLLIDVICKIAQNGSKELWREVKTSMISGDRDLNRSKSKSQLFNVISENKMMNRIFSYTLIFVLLQIIGFGLSFAQNESFTDGIMKNSQSKEKFSSMNMMMNHQYQEDYFGLPRILSEEKEIQDNEQVVPTMMTSDKISLSMRNILSSLNINVNAMVMSKDRKIAYATVNLYGVLKIIDISDLKSPFILGSLDLKASLYGYRIKSLALSSDEKTLFASNSRELEIIDVTEPGAPKLISFTKSEIFDDNIRFEVSEYFLTSLSVSERTKTLFIGGLGLQVYDISNPKEPVLLKAITNSKDDYEGFLKNEICLSRDGQVLFMANGTLDVYNISNPKDMKKLNTLKTESNPRSLLLSEDDKTIFLLGTDERNQLILEEVDSSSLSVRNTFRLGYETFETPRFLTLSPSKSKFFIHTKLDQGNDDFDLLVFDYIKETTTKIENGLMTNTFVMNLSPDGRTLIAGSNSQFLVIELYLDYPNSRIFSETMENQISNFSLPQECQDLQVSNDGKYVFILRNEPRVDDYPSKSQSADESDLKTFEIWDVSNSSTPHVLNSYRGIPGSPRIYFTKNFETVYLLGLNYLTLLDISNKSSIKEKKTYQTQKSVLRLFKLAISSDGETGFLFMNKDGQGVVTFMNFSETTEIEGFVTLDREFTLFQSHLILKDDKTLIVLDKEIIIYDISNLHSPVQVASLPYGINEIKPEIISCTVSPDKQTLFIHTSDRNYFTKLRIYNISDATSPYLISDKYFSKYINHPRGSEFFFPPHSESGFLFQNNSFIKLNLTDLKKPMISGIISLPRGLTRELAISADGQTIYRSTNSRKEIEILNTKIEYTLYLNKEKHLLGEKYSNQISMLRLSGRSDYDLLESRSYKIIKLSLLDIQIVPNKVPLEKTISSLPSWIAFDGESNTLTLNPKKQSEMGAYTLHSAFSLKVPIDVFNGTIIGKDGNPMISENLVAWLMSLDYLDSELFLTAKFKSLETFYLPDQFLDYKEQIYNILKGFYLETCTMFDVVSSLDIEKNNLVVSSLSTNNIKAEITVNPKQGSDVKFVNVPYGGLLPVIRDNKTKVVLEGTIAEVNLALRSVVVNFENGTLSDATVVIKDSLNPPVSVEIFNVSKYFQANTPPRLNSNADHQTLQEQINNAEIQTGKYFTYSLTNDIFEDDYAESLIYEVAAAHNGTGFPTWLSFSGLTLKGTPPEEIFGRDIDLVLIARNEFKQFGVPFKVHIKISAVFWLKLLSRYSPYILTLLGLLVSANKIFNILAKRRYRHPKEYQLNVGEEISSESIFPISFVKEEKIQSQLILKYFKKSWRDFIDPMTEVLNKQKIVDRIQEVVQEMPFKERERINRYPSKIIDQLVINKFVMIQLDSDMKTKSLFEKLKSGSLEVIERDLSSPSGFMINQNKLKKLLMPFNKNNNDLEESLISNVSIPEVNLELFKDAILAYGFEMYSIDISPVDVDITIKQLVPSRLLFSFLKLDLKDINLQDKNKIDYGINYKIIDDKLCFSGVTQSYFQKKTLAVQIKNRRHKILKEIWIHGTSNNLQQSILLRTDQESRGKGYEAF